jgi:hypothetical protein
VNEEQLRWGAAWWAGHALVGFGIAVLATALFGKKAAGWGAALGIVAHHVLDVPIAVALFEDGI